MAGINRLRAAAEPLARRLAGALSSRAYGSAAALELYDYEEDWYREEPKPSRRQSQPMAETVGAAPERGVQWVIMGEPAAKKHVYAERLSKLLDVPHISMGFLLRQELHPGSSLYRQIANAVNLGELVPEEIIFGLLSNRLEEGYCRGETGFILDGIPRTRMQAEILDRIADIDLVVNFKCTTENFMNVPIKEGTHSPCGGSIHSLSNSMSAPNLLLQDDHINSSNSDARGNSTNKFRIYAEQGKLLEDYYRKQRKLLNFQVAGVPGETWQGLLAALHLQHMNALSSSHKLTA